MVTVIIPTYKRADFIDRAIHSVLNQTYKDIEIIIVDDNDSSSTERKIMEEKMSKYNNNTNVIYLKHEKNKNGACARNTGINHAKGDYITFLDDDDFFLKDRIKSLVKVLETNIQYDCAYTNVIKINGSKIRNIIYATKSGNQQYEMLIQNSFLGTGSNIFLRRRVFDELKKFDEDFFRYQDLEFMVRFFRNYNIIAVNEFTVVKDEKSRINATNQLNLYKMLNLFLKKFENDIKKYNNYKKIYFINYNRLYNVITDRKIKKDIKKEMILLNLKPKINFKQKVINFFPYVRRTLSILRGKTLSKKLSKETIEEIDIILKEE